MRAGECFTQAAECKDYTAEWVAQFKRRSGWQRNTHTVSRGRRVSYLYVQHLKLLLRHYTSGNGDQVGHIKGYRVILHYIVRVGQ